AVEPDVRPDARRAAGHRRAGRRRRQHHLHVDAHRPGDARHQRPLPGEVGQVTARLREQRGAALVEFAIIFPVFFLVITGSVAMVWLVGVRSTITGAARDGARYASIQTDPLAGYP